MQMLRWRHELMKPFAYYKLELLLLLYQLFVRNETIRYFEKVQIKHCSCLKFSLKRSIISHGPFNIFLSENKSKIKF